MSHKEFTHYAQGKRKLWKTESDHAIFESAFTHKCSCVRSSLNLHRKLESK